LSETHRHQLLYISRLVPSAGYEAFAAICQISRRRNAEFGLKGVLLFDGHRFCQLLEGPAAGLTSVRNAIAVDPRHEFMCVLVDRALVGAPTAAQWEAGYCGPDELELFLGPDRLSADDTMARFHALITRSDLSP
jgi:Sensors of blue-light using FAD